MLRLLCFFHIYSSIVVKKPLENHKNLVRCLASAITDSLKTHFLEGNSFCENLRKLRQMIGTKPCFHFYAITARVPLLAFQQLPTILFVLHIVHHQIKHDLNCFTRTRSHAQNLNSTFKSLSMLMFIDISASLLSLSA